MAPFYYNWPLQFALLDDAGAVVESVRVDGNLPSIMPGDTVEIAAQLPAGAGTVAVSIPNAMEGGAPLRFANVTQDADAEGYLTLGTVEGSVPSETPSADEVSEPAATPSGEPSVIPTAVGPKPGLPRTGE